MEKTITLIVNEHSVTRDPRDTAELHGGLLNSKSKIEKKIDVLGENLEKCMTEISELLSKVHNHAIENWTIDGVTVGIALSAEGSIGIATAGVEASLEVSFKPNIIPNITQE